MKSKCKCRLSFLDNKKLCHGLFPFYCIIKIIINKKERTSLAQMFLFIRTITASGLSRSPSWKPAFRNQGAEVLCQEPEWQQTRLGSCKFHTHRNVGRKEDLEGPMQVCSKSPGPPHWVLDRWPGASVSFISASCACRAQCTVQNASVTSKCLESCRCHHKHEHEQTKSVKYQ